MNHFEHYFNIYIIACGVLAQFIVLYSLYRLILAIAHRNESDEHEQTDRARG